MMQLIIFQFHSVDKALKVHAVAFRNESKSITFWKMRRNQIAVIRLIFCCLLLLIIFVPLVSQFFRLNNSIGSHSVNTNWVPVDDMTYQHIVDYIRWTNEFSCKLAKDFGSNIDGKKSVCLDQNVGPEPGNCLVYSFGTNHEWFFDEAIANYGCQVYAFDPMAQQNYTRTKNIHVYNFGLSYKTGISVQNWTVLPLKKIYQRLTHLHGEMPISYLKIDLEDIDLRVLTTILQSNMLQHVIQLALEVHVEPEGTIEDTRDLVEILQAFEERGMVRFASNGVPSSRDWLQEIEFEGELIYDITWYNGNLTSGMSTKHSQK